MRLAENAGEARAYRSQTRPDLVLLDIWMPDTDGITLLKEWASAGLLTMPVVMMSGHGTIDTAVEATRIGAFDFLEKPIALQKLLATVGRALKHGGEQRAAGALARHARARAARRRAEAAPGARRRPARAAASHRRARLRHRAVRRAFCTSATRRGSRPIRTGMLAEAPLELLNQAREGILFLQEIAELSKRRAEGAAAPRLQARALQRAPGLRRLARARGAGRAGRVRQPAPLRRGGHQHTRCRACASTARTCPISPTSCCRAWWRRRKPRRGSSRPRR